MKNSNSISLTDIYLSINDIKNETCRTSQVAVNQILTADYLPMQNLLKILPRTSSVVISPMMEPRW